MEKIGETAVYSENVGDLTVVINANSEHGSLEHISGRILKTVNEQSVNVGNFYASVRGSIAIFLNEGITLEEKKSVVSAIFDAIEDLKEETVEE